VSALCRHYGVSRGGFYRWQRHGVRVRRLGFVQSASARGPGDNAHMESFFHSLKMELTRGVVFAHDVQLRRALQHYMHYDNTTRLHSSLGYRSPLALENINY
jgi:putative transposase